jgi:hypothetical protein
MEVDDISNQCMLIRALLHTGFDIDYQDESTHMTTGETDEEVQDLGLAFDDNLDHDVDDIEIEEEDCVFMVIVYPVNPHHFICALSTVSGGLANASARNSQPKGFYETMPTALYIYANIFSEIAFDTLPECWKWNHAIELECEPSPGFRKVYLMTLTEWKEMIAFLEEALDTGHIRQSKSPLV